MSPFTGNLSHADIESIENMNPLAKVVIKEGKQTIQETKDGIVDQPLSNEILENYEKFKEDEFKNLNEWDGLGAEGNLAQ